MDKLTTLLDGANDLLKILLHPAAFSGPFETLQSSVDVVSTGLPSRLHTLWGRFSIFNDAASATSILANVLVAAYFLACLFEVC